MTPDPDLPWFNAADSGFNTHLGDVKIAYRPKTDDGGSEHIWYGRLDLEAKHMNLGGVCHGGVMMTLADIVMGTATYLSGGMHQCATIQMDSHFLAAAKQGQTLLAVTQQLRRTPELSFMTCEVWGGDRKVLIANGVWKYLARAKPTKAPLD